MPRGVTTAELEALRTRAERALTEDGREPRREALEALLNSAPEGGDNAIFAHRHLGELLLEENAWRAALHLRHVVRAQPGNDVGHALLGLCHALLGNYQACIASFRRALALSPSNAFYEHNLGHILDLGLDRPEQAEPYLRRACEHSTNHHEIVASHAHCLARLGRFREARQATATASTLRPDHAGHRALIAWIDAGAPPDSDPTGSPTQGSLRAPPAARPDSVAVALDIGMADAAASAGDIARAQALWMAFAAQERPRVRKPEVIAAAVDYALACVVDGHDLGPARFASHYGVSRSALTNRVQQIVDSLGLTENDPRYRA